MDLWPVSAEIDENNGLNWTAFPKQGKETESDNQDDNIPHLFDTFLYVF